MPEYLIVKMFIDSYPHRYIGGPNPWAWKGGKLLTPEQAYQVLRENPGATAHHPTTGVRWDLRKINTTFDREAYCD